jgi:hypothetical protein
MSPQLVFPISLVFGYVAWLLCFFVYIEPRLRSMDRFGMHRAVATLHSFRFIGLAFIVPGVTGPDLPAAFSRFAAYCDLTTALFAALALLTVKTRPVFWVFVTAFNIVGLLDIIIDYFHAIENGVPAAAGQLGATFFIVTLLVPLLVITNIYSLYSLARSRSA